MIKWHVKILPTRSKSIPVSRFHSGPISLNLSENNGGRLSCENIFGIFIIYWVVLRHRPIAPNVGAYAVAGMGGFENVAERNVKPDQLRTVHQPKYLKETNLRIYTTPRYWICTLLCVRACLSWMSYSLKLLNSIAKNVTRIYAELLTKVISLRRRRTIQFWHQRSKNCMLHLS